MTRIPLEVEDIEIVENNAYFFASHFNGLYSMNMSDKAVKFCGRVPWESTDGERLFASMMEVDKKIYLIPFAAKDIAVYDIATSEFSKIELKKELHEKDLLFLAVEKSGKDLFLFGVRAACIIKLDTKTNEMVYLSDWYDKVKPFIFNAQDAFFRRQVVTLFNKIYIPFCNANAILELDSNTLETQIHVLGKEKCGYSGICFDGKEFWCSPRTKKDYLLEWNMETGETTYTPQEDNMYVGIAYCGGKVKLFPDSIYTFVKPNEKGIIYFVKSQYAIFIGKENYNQQEGIPIEVDLADIPIKEKLAKGFVNERKDLPLIGILKLLVQDGMEKEQNSGKQNLIGNKIYDFLK